jgi:hypothetical protein
MKYDSRRCKAHPDEVRSFGAIVLGYTDEGRRIREEAAREQQKSGSCQWLATFAQGWTLKALDPDDVTRYGDCVGKQFWINHNDLALFKENIK